MSLASILLEGYNGYGNTNTISDPVAYLNEAAMECITGLYEASQQYYTDDIYGQAAVLMEGANAGSKLKEMWNKFVTAIKKVIDKFVEKIKNFVAAIRSRFSKQKKNAEEIKKVINSKPVSPSKNTKGGSPTQQSKPVSPLPNDVMKTISDTNAKFDRACEYVEKYYDANGSDMVDSVRETVENILDGKDLFPNGGSKDMVNRIDEFRAQMDEELNDNVRSFVDRFGQFTGVELDKFPEKADTAIQVFSNSVAEGMGTPEDAKKILESCESMDSRFQKVLKVCENISDEIHKLGQRIENFDISKLSQNLGKADHDLTETDTTKLVQFIMYMVNAMISNMSKILGTTSKLCSVYSSYSGRIHPIINKCATH